MILLVGVPCPGISSKRITSRVQICLKDWLINDWWMWRLPRRAKPLSFDKIANWKETKSYIITTKINTYGPVMVRRNNILESRHLGWTHGNIHWSTLWLLQARNRVTSLGRPLGPGERQEEISKSKGKGEKHYYHVEGLYSEMLSFTYIEKGRTLGEGGNLALQVCP